MDKFRKLLKINVLNLMYGIKNKIMNQLSIPITKNCIQFIGGFNENINNAISLYKQ